MQPLQVFQFDADAGDWVPVDRVGKAVPEPVAREAEGAGAATPSLRLATFNVLADCFPFVVRLAINSPARFAALPLELQAVNADVVGLNEVTPTWLSALCACPHIRNTYLLTDAPAQVPGPQGPHTPTTTRNGSLGARMGNLLLVRRGLAPALSNAAAYTWATPGTAMDRGPALVRLDLDRARGVALVVASVHTLAYARNARVRHAQVTEVVAAVQRSPLGMAVVERAGVGRRALVPVVVMGDLNLHELQEDGVVAACGMVDLWAETHFAATTPYNDGHPGFTFDVTTNALIPRYIPPERRRMRLDRVLLSAGSPWHPMAPATLFATTPLRVPVTKDLFLSDHYGIAVDLEWRGHTAPFRGDPGVAAVLAANAALPAPPPYTLTWRRSVPAFARHVVWLLWLCLCHPAYAVACAREPVASWRATGSSNTTTAPTTAVASSATGPGVGRGHAAGRMATARRSVVAIVCGVALAAAVATVAGAYTRLGL